MSQADHYLTRAEDAHVWTQFAAHHQGRAPATHADAMLAEFRKRFPPGEPPLCSTSAVDQATREGEILAVSVTRTEAGEIQSIQPVRARLRGSVEKVEETTSNTDTIDSQWPLGAPVEVSLAETIVDSLPCTEAEGFTRL